MSADRCGVDHQQYRGEQQPRPRAPPEADYAEQRHSHVRVGLDRDRPQRGVDDICIRNVGEDARERVDGVQQRVLDYVVVGLVRSEVGARGQSGHDRAKHESDEHDRDDQSGQQTQRALERERHDPTRSLPALGNQVAADREEDQNADVAERVFSVEGIQRIATAGHGEAVVKNDQRRSAEPQQIEVVSPTSGAHRDHPDL